MGGFCHDCKDSKPFTEDVEKWGIFFWTVCIFVSKRLVGGLKTRDRVGSKLWLDSDSAKRFWLETVLLLFIAGRTHGNSHMADTRSHYRAGVVTWNCRPRHRHHASRFTAAAAAAKRATVQHRMIEIVLPATDRFDCQQTYDLKTAILSLKNTRSSFLCLKQFWAQGLGFGLETKGFVYIQLGPAVSVIFKKLL